MARRLAIIAFGVSYLLLADDTPPRKVQISKTERLDFQAGGVLRIKNSLGEVAVEGWDRPDAEITTVKSTKGAYPPQKLQKARDVLDRVQIGARREGDELIITTEFPGRHALSGLLRGVDFDLDYRIHVPVDTRLIAERAVGEVHVNNLTNDIQVAVRQGEITLGLPEEGRYTISAQSDFGDVVSDFPGQEKRRLCFIGDRIENDAPAPHKLNLRIGYGNIIILKTMMPKMPALSRTAKQDGLVSITGLR